MSQIATVSQGKDAVQEFLNCLNSFFQDDATGKAYVVTRGVNMGLNMVPLTGGTIEEIALDAQKDASLLTDYEMIVIDSGNSHGDSWKAIFHPNQLVLNFVREDNY